MPSFLADRLNLARHDRFVGRNGELELFKTAIQSDVLPFFILHIFGPGGVGKTNLLQEFALLCERLQLRSIYVDARNIDPSPDAFTKTISASLGLGEGTSLLEFLAAASQKIVFLVDTYEALAPLDGWLQETLLPQLPETVLTVLAGRNPPEAGWRSDPGWQSLIRTVSLRNLNPEESRAFLIKRGIPEDQHSEVLGFTHGHPLALSLVADVFSQHGNVTFRPEESPDVVKTLMERFIQQVPGPAHRAALEACAQVRVLTEALLAEMLSMTATTETMESTHALFGWLRGLSFMESSSEGIFPHDLARETLVADLRWRNPDWYVELHNRARKYYTGRLKQTTGLVQQRLMLDTVFLHRDNAVIRSFFDWQTTSGMIPYALQAEDIPALEKMVAAHEGNESSKLAAYWIRRFPQGATVWRGADASPAGFILALPLHEVKAEEVGTDPAVVCARAYLDTYAPLRPGEIATLFRFWMAAETYQNISPIQSLIFIQAAKHYLTTTGLAFTFFPCAEPDFWAAILDYAELTRLPQADFAVDKKHYGVYGHDWRAMSQAAWIAKLAEKEVGATGQSVPPTVEPILVLSQSDFNAAVRRALQDYARPGELIENPLLQSKLVLQRVGKESGDRREILRSELILAAESFRSNPRDEKLFRALEKTYFHPAANQEAAAEQLDLPFSTYRRHLTGGVQRLTDLLWQREISEK